MFLGYIAFHPERESQIGETNKIAELEYAVSNRSLRNVTVIYDSTEIL